MINDIVSSFKDNIYQKTSNPFLGTFIIVWLVRNWKVVYAVFNIDKDTKLVERIEIIEAYLKGASAWENLLSTVLFTLSILIVTYFLLSITRLIVSFYDKIVNPFFYKATDKNSVILRTDYLSLESKKLILEKKLDEERSKRIKLQSDFDVLEKRFFENLKLLESFRKKTEDENNRVQKIINKLKTDHHLKDEFLKVVRSSFDRREINLDDVSFFLNHKLIKLHRQTEKGIGIIDLTDDGKIAYEAVLLTGLQ